MMRQFKIFRRTSEASLALEWIEECVVKTNWWIKIQSSADEGRLIAPTPPASPQSQFSEDSVTSLSYQKCMEIASPTLEDHILDFALLYRRNQNGQLVLLSEDIPLKIKCMAEVSEDIIPILFHSLVFQNFYHHSFCDCFRVCFVSQCRSFVRV